MVPAAGVEPARPYDRQILSLLCLPIPPSGQTSENYLFLTHSSRGLLRYAADSCDSFDSVKW